MKKEKLLIQGYPGSFHDVACQAYFGDTDTEVIPCDSFSELAQNLTNEEGSAYGIMAIENSIAGSILQNYRILREHKFNIIGEIYLRIEHCLMALPGQTINDLTEVHSHPMAINQCREYFSQYTSLKLVDMDDTALSAKLIRISDKKGIGAIASRRAAEIYQLEILQENIEDNKHNYTRFFVIHKQETEVSDYNKATIWIRLHHTKGSLSTVLNKLVAHDINLSSLQSYPVLGKFSEYFFHMDLEFETPDKYERGKKIITELCLDYQELGRYKRADISAALNKELTSVML